MVYGTRMMGKAPHKKWIGLFQAAEFDLKSKLFSELSLAVIQH